MKKNPLHHLMNPSSIATVGAGNNPLKMGTLHAITLIKAGFKGKYYPVHPREKTVFGHKAYKKASDLPEAPDLVIMVTPSDQIASLLEEFGRIGTKSAIIITAGFKETGIEGRKMEDRLNEISDKYGIRFVGPNCMGILNSQISLNTTVMNIGVKPGGLGLLSQSGTYIVQTLPYLKKRGIRLSKAISLGNEANISIVDALEYLGQDKDTKAIAMYIEGVRDGRRFIEIAREITPNKPVIAQYVGGSEAGARSGLSHTGAMSGPDFLFDGIFKQAGIIRVHSVEDLYAHGWTLAAQPPLKGNRLGIVTNSGGPGTSISNTANMGGMELPVFSEGLQKELRKFIPPHSPSGNPVDLTFHLDISVLTTKMPELIMKSGEVDGLIVHGAFNSGMMRVLYPSLKDMLNNVSEEAFLETMKNDMTEAVPLPKKYNIPLLVSSFFDWEDNCTVAYHENDIPVFDSPAKTAQAMLSLLRYKEIRDRKKPASYSIPDVNRDAAGIIEEAKKKGQRALDEYQSKRILAAYGIPVSNEKLAGSAEEAVSAAGELGYPVVMKACSNDILHKTGKGLVYLDIRGEEQAADSYNKIVASVGSDVPVLICEMVAGKRELVVGMTRFQGFGPCVLLGLGGIFTEILLDNTIRSAPLSITEAEEMLFDIRADKIFREFRGMPAVNSKALAEIIQNVGFISILHQEIAEIDLNPVILNGAEPVVADALVVLE